MKTWNPIQNEAEFSACCKSSQENVIRIVEYVIDELDSGWRNLSRRDSDIRKHQLRFLEELVTRIQNAAVSNYTTNVRS